MTVLGPTPPRCPIGIDDYVELRSGGYTYVDKTSFIAEVLGGGAMSLLVQRPRRFGKSLNMSALRWFVERDPENDRTAHFEDTYIWTVEDGRYREHFQRYPVVALSFKDVTGTSWLEAWQQTRRLLQAELTRVWDANGFDARFRDDALIPMLHARMSDPDAPPVEFIGLLGDLADWCVRATGERLVVLVDDYDAPLLAAWQHGYWQEALAFFMPFLSSGLKDQPKVFRGVLSGILCLATEGIFSGLNNLQNHTIVQDRMADTFGFTEGEVAELAETAGLASEIPRLAELYNGYRMGLGRRTTVYNPGSVLMFLDEGASTQKSPWGQTSSINLVNSQLLRHAAAAGPIVERLLRGETFDTLIDENVPLHHLARSAQVLWSLLTFSGYLTPEAIRPTRNGLEATLRIPNHDVRRVFEDVYRDLLVSAVGVGGLDSLSASMLCGDGAEVESALERTLATAMSLHDFGTRPVEAVYQAFIVGLLVHLAESHIVRSNRESGHGRADVLIAPRSSGPGVILELKVIDKRRETRKAALKSAIAQLQSRDYAAEVRAGGATEVHQYGVVFDGKRCWVAMV